MSALSIQVPFPVFQDRDGQPLDNGYVWLGTSSLNPQTNPVVAYYDSALTIVATQPLRTLNGFISRAGSPAQVYVDAVNFSILVQDSKGTTVFSVPEGTGISPNASGVVYDPAGTGAVATTVQAKLRETVSVSDNASLSAIVSAIGATATTLNITTAVSISANLTIPSNVIVRFTNTGFVTITGSATLTINGPFEAPAKQVFSIPTCTAGSGTGPVLATITNNVVFGGTAKPIVNPRWFGAGGGADDWAALQGAIWAVTSSAPGLTVQLENNVTYTVSKSIVIDTAYFRLLGAPGAKIKRKSTNTGVLMNPIDTGHEGRYTWGPSYPISGVEMVGVEVDGNKANNTDQGDDTYDNGFSLLYLSESKIIGCTVRNVFRFGIPVSNSNDVLVDGCYCYACDENGLYAETGARIIFSNNNLRDCSTVTYNMGAISMNNIVGGTITGNTTSAGYDGIYLRNVCNGIAVTGNAILNPTRYGIRLKDETDAFGAIPINNTISGNTVVNSGSYPLFLELDRNTVVTGNSFNTTAAYCVRFRNGQYRTISGNVMTGFTTAPVYNVGGNTFTYITDVSGTWTPVVLGLTTAGTGTYSVQTGRYTYVGNRIVFSAIIVQSAHTGTGQAALSIPVAINASDTASNCLVQGYNFAYTGWLNGLGANTQSYFKVHTNNGGTLSNTAVPGAATFYYSGQFEY